MVPISELRLKLQALKKLDGGGLFRSAKLSVFGASAHLYKFNHCLSETALHEFEIKHSIELPVDYRNFLEELGNGGTGPGYGLLKLQDWSLELEIISASFLSTPFPYASKWNKHRPSDIDHGTYYETKEFQQGEIEYFENKHITGTMRLSHYGCAIYYFLVVTGVEKGNVWVDDRANDSGLYPAISKAANEKMTFSKWYDKWLQESLEIQ